MIVERRGAVQETHRGYSVQTLLSLAPADPERAKERFPARFLYAAIVDDRSGLSDMIGKLEHLVDHPDEDPKIVLDMRGSDYQRQVWTVLREVPAGETTNYGSLAAKLGTRDARDRGNRLERAIERFGLTSLFYDNGPGRHHHAIRPTGYDYHADAVDAWGMERWRADYRTMRAAQQMLAASIIWLYRGGKDNRWLRRVPCTWHAADAIDEMRRRDVLADWGRLISLYPGW